MNINHEQAASLRLSKLTNFFSKLQMPGKYMQTGSGLHVWYTHSKTCTCLRGKSAAVLHALINSNKALGLPVHESSPGCMQPKIWWPWQPSIQLNSTRVLKNPLNPLPSLAPPCVPSAKNLPDSTPLTIFSGLLCDTLSRHPCSNCSDMQRLVCMCTWHQPCQYMASGLSFSPQTAALRNRVAFQRCSSLGQALTLELMPLDKCTTLCLCRRKLLHGCLLETSTWHGASLQLPDS